MTYRHLPVGPGRQVHRRADAAGSHTRLSPGLRHIPAGCAGDLAWRREGRVQACPQTRAGQHVSGRVLDENGFPLRAAPVSVPGWCGLVGGKDEMIVLSPGALPTAAEAAELPPGSVARQGSIRTALSDAQGRFRGQGIGSGTLSPSGLTGRQAALATRLHSSLPGLMHGSW